MVWSASSCWRAWSGVTLTQWESPASKDGSTCRFETARLSAGIVLQHLVLLESIRPPLPQNKPLMLFPGFCQSRGSEVPQNNLAEHARAIQCLTQRTELSFQGNGAAQMLYLPEMLPVRNPVLWLICCPRTDPVTLSVSLKPLHSLDTAWQLFHLR